jgi:hypothetical protein
MFRAVSRVGLALVFGALGPGPGGIGSVSCGLSSAGGGPTWRVQRSSTGGFTGKGGPNLVVTSDGELLVMPGGLGSAPKSGAGAGADATEPLCRMKLTSEQFSRVAIAVDGAKPAAWGNKKYVDPKNPQGCCDQFLYTLRFERRGGDAGTEQGEASWYDDSIGRLPGDVKALSDALDKVQPEGGHCPM